MLPVCSGALVFMSCLRCREQGFQTLTQCLCYVAHPSQVRGGSRKKKKIFEAFINSLSMASVKLYSLSTLNTS